MENERGLKKCEVGEGMRESVRGEGVWEMRGEGRYKTRPTSP